MSRLISLIVLVTVSAFPSAAARSDEGLLLKISLAAGQSGFLPLVPVVIRIELANESGTTRTIAGAGLGCADYAYFRNPPRYLFHVQGPDGSTKTVHFSDWVGWSPDIPGVPNPPRSLAAEHAQVLEYTLGLAVEDFSLPRPEYKELQKRAIPVFSSTGEYRVRLSLPRYSPPVQSNVLTIRIREPKTPEDVLAHDILSRSSVPDLFFNVPATFLSFRPRGITNLDSRRLGNMRDSGTTSPLDTCRQILADCPGSSYAPHARLFLAVGLCRGWEEYFARERGGTFNVDRRVERVRFLYQVLHEGKLPAHTRERACLILRDAAKRIDTHTKSEARKTAPSLEQVLGVQQLDLGGITPDLSDTVFYAVFEITRGSTEWKSYDDILNSKLTPRQMETLITAVTTNELIQRANGFSPLQLEVQGYINWATQELRKLPWHDPDTGLLTMAGRPASQP